MSYEQTSTISVASSRPVIARWWSNETAAIVTGGNKGIGFALVKRLAELGLTVVLTARDGGRGLEAVQALKSEGLDVHFFCLDVSNPNSIQAFASWFQHTFGANLDILINNAAVSFNDVHENSVKHAETVIKTNFYGPKLLIEALLPLFRCSAVGSRVLNISSRLGLLNKLENPKLKEILKDEKNLSENQIEGMLNLFLQGVKNGTWTSYGWPRLWTDYSVSKLALNSYSKILAKRYERKGLSVNCFCPGFTKTSMTGGKGKHTADAVAEVGAWLALLPVEKLQTGKFYVLGREYTNKSVMAKAIADTFPHIHCTVLDLPHLVAGLNGTRNLEFVGGDMFEHIPAADAIVMKWILHGWSDQKAIEILKRCKEAITSKGKIGVKVIIIDMAVDDDQMKSPNINDNSYETQLFFDLLVMTANRRKERNKNEWAKLFLDAGFTHYKITPLSRIRSILEVYP